MNKQKVQPKKKKNQTQQIKRGKNKKNIETTVNWNNINF